MNESTRKALRAELGTSPPHFLDDLDDAELADLANVLSEARTRQAEAVEEAIDKAMRYIPWGLRGAVRKVLIG